MVPDSMEYNKKDVPEKPEFKMEVKDELVSEPEFRYSLEVDGEWTPDMYGLHDPDGDRAFAGYFGRFITGLKVDGVAKYRVHTNKGWSGYSESYNKPARNKGPIDAFEIVAPAVKICVHVKGGEWLGVSSGSLQAGDAHAGIFVPIDALWMTKE